MAHPATSRTGLKVRNWTCNMFGPFQKRIPKWKLLGTVASNHANVCNPNMFLFFLLLLFFPKCIGQVKKANSAKCLPHRFLGPNLTAKNESMLSTYLSAIPQPASFANDEITRCLVGSVDIARVCAHYCSDTLLAFPCALMLQLRSPLLGSSRSPSSAL